MKAKIGSVEVEGTAEEIAELLRTMGIGGGDRLSGPNLKPEQVRYPDESVAYDVLSRRPLSSLSKQLLQILQREYPGWSSAADLQREMNLTAMQLGGLLGALGKRANTTPSYRQGDWFLEQDWDYHAACNIYRLPEGVLQAVKRLTLNGN